MKKRHKELHLIIMIHIGYNTNYGRQILDIENCGIYKIPSIKYKKWFIAPRYYYNIMQTAQYQLLIIYENVSEIVDTRVQCTKYKRCICIMGSW